MSSGLQQEVAEVRARLSEVANTLHPTLSEFMKDELGRHKRLDVAQVVLAAALPEQDSPVQRERRIYLAAALELLVIALAVHKLLLSPASGNGQIDRNLAGGTVLAGDYCFSRAAALAARTQNPQVVAIFAGLLQQLSEGHLRRIFEADTAFFNEKALLYRDGAWAAAVLAGLPEEVAQATADFGAWAASGDGKDTSSDQFKALGLPSFQEARWHEILEQQE